MSAPTITSLTVAYPPGREYLLPGESAMVTVEVYDPTGSVAEVTVTVTDAAGHTSTGIGTVVMNDQVTSGAVLRQMDYDAGWEITQTGEYQWAVAAPDM